MSTALLHEMINWLSFPLLGALIAILLVRKIQCIYPAFFVYAVSEFLSDAGRFIVYYSGGSSTRLYKNTYWTTDIITTIFAALVIYELFVRRIFPGFQKIRFYRSLFPIAALVIIVLAGLNLTNNIKLTILLKTLHVIDFVRAATIFFFVALMLLVGRRWERHEFGIALGMAIESCTSLVAFIIPFFPVSSRGLVHTIPVIGYDVACLVWLVYFARAGKLTESPHVEPVTPELVQGAQQAEENLKEWLAGKKSR